MERYLYLNHQKLYEEYREKLHTQENSVEEVIEIIYQVIEQNGDEPFENVKDLLIGLTALYGHTICWGDKGNWAWKGKVKKCWLTDILGTDKQTPLLSFVFSAWDSWREDRQKGDTLLYIYRTTLGTVKELLMTSTPYKCSAAKKIIAGVAGCVKII